MTIVTLRQSLKRRAKQQSVNRVVTEPPMASRRVPASACIGSARRGPRARVVFLFCFENGLLKRHDSFPVSTIL